MFELKWYASEARIKIGAVTRTSPDDLAAIEASLV
jgi:hypothetical protein